MVRLDEMKSTGIHNILKQLVQEVSDSQLKVRIAKLYDYWKFDYIRTVNDLQR